MSPSTSPEQSSRAVESGSPLPVPPEVRALFETDDLLDRFGLAYELATVDEDGWPRIAMLSHGEIESSRASIRLALWAGSTTGKNLAAGRPAILSVVREGSVCYLSGRAKKLRSVPGLDAFEMIVERVRLDSHEGFQVRSPIMFDVEHGDRGAALAEWRRQLEILHG